MTLPDGYITRRAAAKELRVSLSTLERMVRRGTIIQHRFSGHKHQYFLLADLQLLQLTSRERGTDLREVKAIALQALAAARLAERRLDSVYAFLGIDVPPLQRDADSVRGLYKEALQGSQTIQVRDPVWLRYWSCCFFAMDDIYFMLVETVTDESEPWRIFVDFSSEIAQELTEEPEVARSLAGRFFEAARRSLFHAAYVHCRRSSGKAVANAAFRGGVGAVDELVEILRG